MTTPIEWFIDERANIAPHTVSWWRIYARDPKTWMEVYTVAHVFQYDIAVDIVAAHNATSYTME